MNEIVCRISERESGAQLDAGGQDASNVGQLYTFPGQGEFHGIYERFPGEGGAAHEAVAQRHLQPPVQGAVLLEIRRLHRRVQESQHSVHAPLRESHQGDPYVTSRCSIQ